MSYVVAIGGGEIGRGETLLLDKHIIDLTEKTNPNVLFLPTASGDEQAYIDKFTDYYQSLGARVAALTVFGNTPSTNEIENKIGEADAVYAGGGNTYTLLEAWKSTGIDEALRRRVAAGVVLGGVSAGANCWFEYASTNSPHTGWPNETYTVAEGLGIVSRVIASPHFYAENEARQPVLIEQLRKLPRSISAIAIDDYAAYVAKIHDPTSTRIDDYCVTNRPHTGVQHFIKQDDYRIRVDELPAIA